eukprot:1698758-Alexandrium_andersonii.AAC.1
MAPLWAYGPEIAADFGQGSDFDPGLPFVKSCPHVLELLQTETYKPIMDAVSSFKSTWVQSTMRQTKMRGSRFLDPSLAPLARELTIDK